jgi:NAD(P)-dependent dehydrogenase (short-subunit alcohol dehydrogenase family)
VASSSAPGGASLLRGRSALVTGASRGIGRAIAFALAEQGARVHLLARTKADLDAVAAVIGEGATSHVCDITDVDAVASVAAAVARATGGSPDVLVNNAGLFPLASLAQIDAEEFERTIAANLVAPFEFFARSCRQCASATAATS